MTPHHRHRGEGRPDYYESIYRSYPAQNPVRKLDHYLSVVEAETAAASPRLLDFGCGPGLFLEHVARRRPDWRLHGADLETAPLEELRGRAGGTIEVEAITGASRPFQGVDFDVITCWDVLEHVPDPVVTLGSFSEWLGPGGILVYVVPVFDGPFGPVIHNLDQDPTHLHRESRRYWLDVTGESFSVLSWHGIFRYLVAARWYVHIPTRLFRRVTPAILVVCRRR